MSAKGKRHEVLLKEINHRVKNSRSLVISGRNLDGQKKLVLGDFSVVQSRLRKIKARSCDFRLLWAGAKGAGLMSLGTILVIILMFALLGGFSGRFGGYGYGFGHGGVGLLGTLLIVIVILMLLGRI
jgi:Protein of unknown function (DUF3309)